MATMSEQSLVEFVLRLKDQMSAPIKQIVTALGATDRATKQASKAIDELNNNLSKVKQVKEVGKNVRDTAKQWKDAENKVKELSLAIKQSGEATKKQKTDFDNAKRQAKELKKVYQDQSSTLRSLKKDLTSTGVDVKKLATEEKRLTDQIKKLNTQVKSTKLNQLKDGLKGVNVSVTSLMTAVAGLGAALSAPFLVAIRSAVKFEETMSAVKGISGAVGNAYRKMEETAQEMGRRTRYTATQSAEGFKYLTMAGLDAVQAVGALPSTLQLAAAGNMDLGRTADITTNILTGYGKKVSELGHVNDVLVQGFTNSNSTLEELGTAFAYVGPIAKGLGIEFEEIVGVLGALHNAGLKGSMAGTALRGALARLITPTEKGAAILDELGKKIGQTTIRTKDSEGKLISFIDILDQLERAGITSEQTMELFGLRAGPGMAALLQQGTNAVADLVGKMNDADGRAKAVAETMEANAAGAFRRFWSAVDGLGQTLVRGLLPAIAFVTDAFASLINTITSILGFFNPLTSIISGLIIATGGLSVAVGALGLAYAFLIKPLKNSYSVFVDMFPSIGRLTKAMSLLRVRVLGAAKAFKVFLLTNPFGWVLAAMTAIYGLIKAYETLSEKIITRSIEKQKQLTNEFGRAERAIDRYNASMKRSNNDSKKQSELTLKFRESLVSLANSESDLSEAARQAKDSIDKNTGAILDNGEAIENLRKLASDSRLMSLAKETDLLSQKLAILTKEANAFERAWDWIKNLSQHFENAVGAMHKKLLEFGESLEFIFGTNIFEEPIKGMNDFLLGAKKTYAELKAEIESYEGDLTDSQIKRKEALIETQKQARKLIDEFKDQKLIDSTTSFGEFDDLVKSMGVVSRDNKLMTDALQDEWTKARVEAKKASKDIADNLRKALIPSDEIKKAADPLRDGFEFIQNLSDDYNKKMLDKDKQYSAAKIAEYKLMYESLSEDSRKGFLDVLENYTNNLSSIENNVNDSAEKQKLITAAKNKFISDNENLMLESLKNEYINTYQQISNGIEETAAKQVSVVKSSADLEKISRVDAANKINEIEANKYSKLKVLADQYLASVESVYGQEHDKYKEAVDQSKKAAEDLSRFKIDAAKRTTAALKAQIDESIAKEKEYSDKALEYTDKINQAKLTTEEKIRNIKRAAMTEEEQEFDRLKEAQEKLSKARELASQGEVERAENMARKSQDVFASLKDQSQALTGIKDTGKVLVEIFEQQKSIAEANALEQKNQQLSLKEQMNNTSAYIDGLSEKMQVFQEKAKVELNINVENAKASLSEFNSLLDQTRVDIPVSIDVADEVQIKLDGLSEDAKKEINVVLLENNVEGRLDEITATKEKIFVIDLKDDAAKKAVRELQKTTYSQHIVYVKKIEQKSQGGLIGEGVLKASKGYKIPGFGLTDRVPALLTMGERVTNAISTRIMDTTFPGLMDTINNIKSVTQAKNLFESKLKAFAKGGLVTQLPLRLNEGGLLANADLNSISNLGRVELQIGNVAYPVVSKRTVVDDLKLALRRENLIRGQ